MRDARALRRCFMKQVTPTHQRKIFVYFRRHRADGMEVLVDRGNLTAVPA